MIDNGKFTVVTKIEKDRYGTGYNAETEEWTFDEYLQSKLGIGNDVKKYLDKEIGKARDQINREVKRVFDESTRNMLSQIVLNVLMANDTYKKIESNIANIANRQ